MASPSHYQLSVSRHIGSAKFNTAQRGQRRQRDISYYRIACAVPSTPLQPLLQVMFYTRQPYSSPVPRPETVSFSPSISPLPHPTSQILLGSVLTSCGPRPSRLLVPLGPLRARLVAPRPSSLVAPRPSPLAPPLGPGSAHRPSRPPSGPPRRSSASVPQGPPRLPPGRVALFSFFCLFPSGGCEPSL